jgi:hypothetical protein
MAAVEARVAFQSYVDCDGQSRWSVTRGSPHARIGRVAVVRVFAPTAFGINMMWLESLDRIRQRE